MSDQLKLREAIPADAKSLLDFLKKASQQSDFIIFDDIKDVSVQVEADSLAEIFDSVTDELIVAQLDDQIIGFCRLEKVSAQEAEFGVVVDKEFWHNGIATYLLEDAMDWAAESELQTISLEVYKDNSVAIHLYQKFGFTIESETEKTYQMKKMV